MPGELNLSKFHNCLESTCPIRATGRVTNVVGLVVEAQGPVSCLGTVCDIYTSDNQVIAAEVSGFKDNKVLLMPLEEIRGIGPGCRVVARQQNAVVPVGAGLLGRVIDGLGKPIDDQGPVITEAEYPIYAPALNPLRRQRIYRPLDLGVRAINGLLTVGCGQRIGVFAGSDKEPGRELERSDAVGLGCHQPPPTNVTISTSSPSCSGASSKVLRGTRSLLTSTATRTGASLKCRRRSPTVATPSSCSVLPLTFSFMVRFSCVGPLPSRLDYKSRWRGQQREQHRRASRQWYPCGKTWPRHARHVFNV